MADYLHQLIHSLTQNEKRYFNLYSQFMFRGNEKRYARLFEVVLKQQEANDDKAKKATNEKHFAQLKQQLYNKILESLRAFHAGNSTRSIIDEYLSDYRILLKKKLLRDALKAIKKAELLALNYELYPELISIKQSETELLVLEADAGKLGKHIEELRKQMPVWLQRIDQTLQIEKEYIYFVKLNKENEFIRSAAEQKVLDEFVEAPVLKSEILTVKGKAYYYYIMGLYQFFSGRFDKSLIAFEAQLSVFEKYPPMAKELINEYAKALANVCLLSNKIMDETKFKDALNALRSLDVGTGTLSEQIAFWNYLLQLNHLVALLKIEEADLFIKQNEEKITELKKHRGFAKIMVMEMNYVMFDTVFVFMCKHQFSKANKIVFQYLNDPDTPLNTDHYHLARIIHLLIQLELGNDDYVENEIRSLTRYLRERKKWHTFESKSINFIMSTINEKDQKKARAMWKKFKIELETLAKVRYEGNAMFSFNFIHWANLKSGTA